MNDLNDLYQEVILDHNRRPRNFRAIPGARCQEGYNPLCGDRVMVYLDVTGGVVRDAAFEGTGCAISKASASLMTEALRGRTVEAARQLFEEFHDLMLTSTAEPSPGLGKLTALAGVREFPSRVKCASLAWHAFKAALDTAPATQVSTE